MKQDIVDQLSEQSGGKSTLPSIQDNSTLHHDELNIDILETEEQEVELTFQRKPQFRINENSRKRFY